MSASDVQGKNPPGGSKGFSVSGVKKGTPRAGALQVPPAGIQDRRPRILHGNKSLSVVNHF